MPKSDPESYMARAIALSRRGYPAPNPHVGCVIVNNGRIVGEGFHGYAGGPHAELVALEMAGNKAKGSTVYVTLEPCNHQGRTPPCTASLIRAGVKRVVYSVADPDLRAQGGQSALVEAGISVESGLLSEIAEAANYRWLSAIRRKRPFVVVKVAMGVDGRIAMQSGESKWITNEKSRREGQKLRAQLGSVLVGAGTVLSDNPKLTARIRGVRNQPVRIVLDPSQKLNGKEQIFHEPGELLRIDASSSNAIQAKIVNDEINLKQLMAALFERGITGVLVEGGSITISKFFEIGLVDELSVFVGAKILGSGRTWIELLEAYELASACKLELKQVRKLGSDVNLVYSVLP